MFSKLHPKRVASNVVSYFKAADAVSRPMAILLSLAAILVVAALLFMVFLGGRWTYDKIRGNDAPAKIETEQTTPSSNDSQSGSSEPAKNQNTTTTAPAASTSTPQTTQQASTPPQSIPNTGPSEE